MNGFASSAAVTKRFDDQRQGGRRLVGRTRCAFHAAVPRARGRSRVARNALEEHFWLPPGADATRTLKTFESGRNRIVAAAQRELLARPDEPLRLTVNDFVIR
jgi:hypothetical protein